MKKRDKIVSTSDTNVKPKIRRRDFFRLLGGGILVFVYPWKESELLALPAEQSRVPKDFNAFLHIAEDGTVSCFTGKVEMGQGSMTGLNQMMADELSNAGNEAGASALYDAHFQKMADDYAEMSGWEQMLNRTFQAMTSEQVELKQPELLTGFRTWIDGQNTIRLLPSCGSNQYNPWPSSL